jgi:hypothetical protein
MEHPVCYLVHKTGRFSDPWGMISIPISKLDDCQGLIQGNPVRDLVPEFFKTKKGIILEILKDLIILPPTVPILKDLWDIPMG